jgi:hypothetical protein
MKAAEWNLNSYPATALLLFGRAIPVPHQKCQLAYSYQSSWCHCFPLDYLTSDVVHLFKALPEVF